MVVLVVSVLLEGVVVVAVGAAAVVVVVVEAVGAAAVVEPSTAFLRGLGLPDCHHCLQWSEEAHAFSQVLRIEEGVAVVATELLETLASAFLQSVRASMSSWSSATCICFSRIQSLCVVRD